MLRLVMVLVGVLAASVCAAVTRVDSSPADVRLSTQDGPLRIVVIGLVHGHSEGLLWNAANRDDIDLVGVYEPNQALFDRLADKYRIPVDVWHDDLGHMLDQTKPEAASVMTSIADHRAAVEACAVRGIHTLVEKPLAFSREDAHAMAKLSREHGVLVLTNYETSWYESVRHAKAMIEAGELGTLRRLEFRHGHHGPEEIGCSEEFLAWLTDPDANGGGAIVDFGCYGAVLATWFMDGARPTSIRAAAHTVKPDRYPRVDDDATIVLTYPGATAVIGASWAWTHDVKAMDVYAERGSLHAGKWSDLRQRLRDREATPVIPDAKPPELRDEWTYLRNVVRGECEVDPLSSLELNVIAAEIIDEARRQVRATR